MSTLKEKLLFQQNFNVSAEEMLDLERYAALLEQWQGIKNLIAPSTLRHVWQRHIADSRQLISLRPESRHWLDLGSGAGFPGLVVALALKHGPPRHEKSISFERPASLAMGQVPEKSAKKAWESQYLVTLVEANARKAAFLRSVSRETRAPAQILNQRIEALTTVQLPVLPDVITARALAPLAELFGLMGPLMGDKTVALVHKGQDFVSELEKASKSWNFIVKQFLNRVDDRGVILQISHLRRK